MIFWRKKKDRPEKLKAQSIVPMKKRVYPPKIKLAWMKALEGNTEITEWLIQNGFKELAMCNQAILLKEEAREWLMHNGFPHLMAFVNAAEGNGKAADWLSKAGMLEYFHMSQCIENQQESWQWLKENSTEDVFLLTKTIKKIKDQIEEDHNDIHTWSVD